MADTDFKAGPTLLELPLEGFGSLASIEDLNTMMRVLTAAADRPDLIPQAFLSYLVEFLQISNIQIRQQQVIGQALTITPATAVAGSESITSTTYVDGSAVGPEVASLKSGYYIFVVGCVAKISSAAQTAYAALSTNSSTPNDGDGVQTSNVDSASLVGFVVNQKLSQENNIVDLKYRVTGGTGTFSNRQLLAIRYANL